MKERSSRDPGTKHQLQPTRPAALQRHADRGAARAPVAVTGHSTVTRALDRLQAMADRSASTTTIEAVQRAAHRAPPVERTHQLQSLADTHAERSALNGQDLTSSAESAVQRSADPMGLPLDLQQGIEQLSGVSMADVKVHRGSAEPARLQAHAFAQGTDIHLGPGQEQHLPHEAWHVVQQKQGRVSPTRQLKGQVLINDDDRLEKEADVMGARALQTKPRGGRRLSESAASGSAVIAQRKAELVKITGVTHLVRMSPDRETLFQGDTARLLKSGDFVAIERNKAYKSRRGPNQEVAANRDTDRTGDQIYRWYQARTVNGKKVSGEDLFLRDRTFVRPATSGAFAVEQQTLLNRLEDLGLIRTQARDVIRGLDAALQHHPAIADAGPARLKAKQSLAHLNNAIGTELPAHARDVEPRYGEIQAQMTALYQALEIEANKAQVAGAHEFGRELITYADQAFQVCGKIEQRPRPTGHEATTLNDEVADAFGFFDTGQTAVHGLGGGILSAATVAAEGSFMAGVATGFGYVAGPLGILCGAIGIFLGLRVAWRGYHSEAELRKLVPTLTSDEAVRIAEYAAEQKRKKKWGGAIVATAGAAAVTAGVVGAIALSVATLGVGAIVLGIGAALIGLGIVLGKWVNRSQKRKRWPGKMAALVLAAAEAGDAQAFPAGLMQLAVNVRTQREGSPERKKAMQELKSRCVSLAESKRVMTAQDTVSLLVRGTPLQKYDATLVVRALKLDPETIRSSVLERGEKTAASLVARKLKSW